MDRWLSILKLLEMSRFRRGACYLVPLLLLTHCEDADTSGVAVVEAPAGINGRKELDSCVLRVWSGAHADMPPSKSKMTADFIPDRVLIVEVKNFNGWVLEKTDELGYVSRELMNNLDAQLETLVRNGLLRKACDARHILTTACAGRLTAVYTQQLVDERVIDNADKEKLDHLFANSDTPAAIPDQVVVNVLGLKAFQSLNSLLKDKPEQKVQFLLRDVMILAQRLKVQKAETMCLRINGIDFEGIETVNASDEGQAMDTAHLKPDSQRKVPGAGEVKKEAQEVSTLNYNDYFRFRFKLVENEQNHQAWAQLRGGCLFTMKRAVTLTLHCPFEEVHYLLESAVVPPETYKTIKEKKGFRTLELSLVNTGHVVMALIALIPMLGIFVFFARETDLIRDLQRPLRPDGVAPYGLAHSQMAFWFILVVAAFVFLWLYQGTLPTLNNTCLILIGIGAGTALGSSLISREEAFQEQENRTTADFEYSTPDSGMLTRHVSESRKAFGVKLRRLIKEIEDELREKGSQPHLENRKHTLEMQLEGFLSQSPGRLHRMLDDWLNDGAHYSFHRYQMLVWTAVLGLIFVITVVQTRTLPEFDNSLLALLGISNGTYLGFRLPSARSR